MKNHLVSFSLALLAVGQLAAQNLIVNESFEALVPGGGERGSGPLTYRPNGGSVPTPFENWFSNIDPPGAGSPFDAVPPRTGLVSAVFGQVGAPGSLFQDVVTIPGTQYVLSFYLAVDNSEGGSGTQTFAASWDGASILFRDDTGFNGTQGYQLYTFNLTASSALTRLEFFGQNDPAFYYLDDVSLVSSVPEPGTWVAAVLSCGALGGFVHRRRRAGATGTGTASPTAG